MDLTPDLVWDALEEAERQVVAGWLYDLGLEPDDWRAVAPFRTLLELLVVHRLASAIAATSSTCLTDAYRAAAETLGAKDSDDRDSAYHRGDRHSRKLRRWFRAAERARGHSVRTPPHEVL